MRHRITRRRERDVLGAAMIKGLPGRSNWSPDVCPLREVLFRKGLFQPSLRVSSN